MLVPGPHGAGHPSKATSPPRPHRHHHQDVGQASHTGVGVSKQEGRRHGGRGGQGSDKGRRGLWETPGITRGQGRVTDSFSGVFWGPSWDLYLPQSVHVLGGLGTRSFSPMPICLGGEVSMQLPPSPTRQHRRPPPTTPACGSTPPGEGSTLHTL